MRRLCLLLLFCPLLACSGTSGDKTPDDAIKCATTQGALGPTEAAERWVMRLQRSEDRASLLTSPEAQALAGGWKEATLLRLWRIQDDEYKALVAEASGPTARGESRALLLAMRADGQGNWTIELEALAPSSMMWPEI